MAGRASSGESSIESDNPHPFEIVPSKVLYRDYIYMPLGFEDFEERKEWQQAGKWLIFMRGDMQMLDNYWTKLQFLLQDGILVCLKASTGTNNEEGVIMCYTRDSEDVSEAKKAADAIRKVTSDENIFFYKTNTASDSGNYRAHGDKNIAKYMHTVACSLYKRDELNRWKKLLP